MENKNIEELETLKNYFMKTVDILDEMINISKEIDATQDNKRIKELEKELDNQTDFLALQMIKISRFVK